MDGHQSNLNIRYSFSAVLSQQIMQNISNDGNEKQIGLRSEYAE